MWKDIPFGKYEGLSIPQVLMKDADYFFWARERGAFGSYGTLAHEARLAHRRATAILVPPRGGVTYVVEYTLDRAGTRLEEVDFVPAERPGHDGFGTSIREANLDLSKPRQFREYDKGAMKILIGRMKEFFFGGREYRLTRDRAEAFFSNPDNFANV
jgi:hypothetical protein